MNTPTADIRFANAPADYDAFGALCRAYVAGSRERYADMPWFVDALFGHQSLDKELEALPVRYGPPQGRTLLAVTVDGVVAAGAWRKRADSICEMKRLYVSDRARGLGLGRRLSESIMASAKEEGFTTMRLDTVSRLTEAIALYDSMGFERIAPYQTYPDPLMPHLIFMQKAL